MADKKNPLSDLLSGLADVVVDLYGENAAGLDRLSEEVQSAPGIDPGAMKPFTPAPATAAPSAARPALPPFEALWKTADESIDWTEALASPTPTDGTTPAAVWTQYHQQAAQVLRGEVPAYLNVLRAANPMADLMPYVASLDVSALNSDELRAVFTARPDLMEKEPRRYLSGMALRIARDLFAVLPVTRVIVTARAADADALKVEFSRQELTKVRFAFIDPEKFVTDCGGVYPQTGA